MQITPESKKVSELFPIVGKVQYRIPNFQRGYSWKNDQIEALFQDICEEEQGYYIGNILVTGDQDEPRVIDGQQRLTTLSLFLLATWTSLGRFQSERKAIQTQGDIERQLFFDMETGTPRIVLLEQDREVYGDLMRLALEKPTQKKWGNRALAKRFKFIRSLVDGLESLSALGEFYDKLSNLEVLKISVPNLGDAFNVFSSLNSKGLPLTLFDLLKGEFISISADAKGSEAKAVSQWNELTKTLTMEEGDTDGGVVTQFLLNNYDAFEGTSTTSTTKGKALSDYQDLLKEQRRSGGDYLSVLIERAHIFAWIKGIGEAGPDWSSEIDNKLSTLDKLDATQALPLLMYLLCKRDELQIDDGLSEILDALTSFYVRRNVVLNLKSSGIRSKMLSMIRAIDREGFKGSRLADYVCGTLRDMCATDEQFRAALEQGIYDKNKKTTRVILIEIERKIGKCPTFDKGHLDSLDKFEVSSSGKVKRPVWSIEHILPEGKLPPCWVDMIASGDSELAARYQAEKVHLLGNLTLTPYNSELSQKPFANDADPYQGSKRDYQKKDTGTYVGLRSGLFLNGSIADVENGECLEDKSSWTIEDIERRNKVLSAYALELFGVPKG